MSPFLFFLPEEKGLRGRPFQVLFPVSIIGLAVYFTFLADLTGILPWWEAAVIGGTLAWLIIGLFWSFAEIQRVNPRRSLEASAMGPADSEGPQESRDTYAEASPDGSD